MANHGSVGNKFVSVNLSKSYGQPNSHNHNHNHNHNPPYSRVRPGSYGGGGGGMVVLSRPRSSQKPVLPKLSVPPPLNLPSLRKEHEKFDSSGANGGPAGGAGSGPRPNSAGTGWTKVGSSGGEGVADNVTGGSSSAKDYSQRVEKAMVLRGEDFPSLKAALPTGPLQKQNDSSHKKQKQVVGEVLSFNEPINLGSAVHMRPQGQSFNPRVENVSNGNGNGGEGGHRLGSLRVADQARRPEYFPGPLPLVRLNPRSDWADDERDTGHGFPDRGRDYGFQKSEAYWDREFDLPRSSVLPRKPPSNLLQHRDETVKGSSSEVLKVHPYRGDVRTPSREGRGGNTWRTPLQKDGFNVQEVGNDRNCVGRPTGLNRDAAKENKYNAPHHGDNARDEQITGNRDSAFVNRDTGNGHDRRQHWNPAVESFSRGAERHTQDRYAAEQSNRYRGDAFRNSTFSKSSFSLGGKGLPMTDPILSIGREKRAFSKTERPYVEDPFLKDFGSTGYDDVDPFSGGIVGVIKRKKDVVKEADFHDPARESFEAELERVQKMQEMERQRIVEEQERAIERAQREEEERERLIREGEERQRRLEEEAQEAAWRAEQERLEAIQKAEEQRLAREEEKRRVFIEEERRKQAAKQKLLELEARIAKRQAETASSDSSASAVADVKVSASVKQRYVSSAADIDNWEDSERMVEMITTSASPDSSVLSRPFGEKPVNPLRSSVFENEHNTSFLLQDQENGHHIPDRDASIGGRAFPRKVFYEGAGYMSSRPYFKGGIQEPLMDEFPHLKEQRWNPSGSQFYGNVGERYGGVKWGQGHYEGEQFYPNPEADELYSYERPRYSMRQPRVLPPPSLASMHKTSFRGGNERPGPSTSLENDMHYHRTAGSESTLQTGYYDVHQEKLEPSELVENTMSKDQKLDKDTTPRCESQSSLSVSSPPTSPTQLSHDELDESGDCPAVPASLEGKENSLHGNASMTLNEKSGKDAMMSAPTSISVDEDEEWDLENNEEMQEQEEYDDGYQEEDEVHEGYDENIDLAHEFEHMHIEGKDSSHMDNLVLGFNEGVEVGIPSDEFERDSKSEENNFGIPEVSAGTIEEQGAGDDIQGDKQSLQHVDGSSVMGMDSPPVRNQETEKGIQDSVSQPINVLHTSTASNLFDSVDATSGSSSEQGIMSAVSPGPSQPDVPVELQFGLFSGPSLIPSPVPSIQIGSIQMPLHLHPSMGPPISNIHPSQPLFQFGQLRYTSNISQGILPLSPQSMSFVQPNIQSHYNLNQDSGASLPTHPPQDTSVHNVANDVPSLSGSECQLQSAPPLSLSIYSEKDSSVSKSHAPLSEIKGERTAYPVRNYGFRSSFRASEASHSDTSGFQRRPRRAIQRNEFRIRENTDRKQSLGSVSCKNSGVDDKTNVHSKGAGVFARSTKPIKPIVESGNLSLGPISSQEINSESRSGKGILHPGEGKLKRNISQEDVDAPLQSGIVCVFKQPGIEATSNEDDFIEVRSKRQMLNERREQREKEIKAKSRATKPPRKVRSSAQSTVPSTISNNVPASLGEETLNDIHLDFVASEGQGLVNKEVSTCFSTTISQPMAPIGTPAVNANMQADKRSHTIKSIQTSAVSVVSVGGKGLGPSLVFESKNNVMDNVQASLVSWGNARTNQQVMALTQTQLDDAMKPARFDSHVSSIGGHANSVSGPLLPPTSISTKDKSVSFSSNPINSLLAGEKIQFGAVTSPTILPPSTHVVTHGIGAPGSFRSEIQISHNNSAAGNDCALLFEKDKHLNESCAHLEDCEAEAEAATSAVAAISSDEIVGNGSGSVSLSDTKGFGGAAVDQRSGSRSRAEESLVVSLPADLSVETQPISLWPTLPSPQNSSTPMLSHFLGAPPPHFPFYEMNSMVGGPIFAYGPHEESGGNQSQPQSNSTMTWQPCHSTMDSFYGPPAGFAGPFISPPGGSHMVVYNHYAPVGQFGQVGLSFMGATYIPSGKQPDWKHNPTSSVTGIGEGDMNNMNLVSSQQRNPPNMPAPVQHLAPGSLLPMPSPVSMFDTSPFQSAPDMSVQPRWSHVPASPLLSVPLSLSLQQQPDGVLPLQFNHRHPVPVEQSPTANCFSESQTSAPSDNGSTFPVVTDAHIARFPNQLGLVDPSSSTVAATSAQVTVDQSTISNPVQDGTGSSNETNAFKTQHSQQKNSSAPHSTGYNYQRGGVSQKTSSAGEWSHRRMGFHGRNQSLGAEKNFPSSKIKQVYVAKQTRSGPSTAG